MPLPPPLLPLCSSPILFRDLSPSNLLLAESPQGDAPPELKVADFGLSACCGGFSATGNENMDKRTNGSNGERGVIEAILLLVLMFVLRVDV